MGVVSVDGVTNVSTMSHHALSEQTILSFASISITVAINNTEVLSGALSLKENNVPLGKCRLEERRESNDIQKISW